MSTTEIIGYISSFLILISFTMKDMRKLRIVNLFGCTGFIIYGIVLNGIPIIITNAAIVIINVYYLFIKKD